MEVPIKPCNLAYPGASWKCLLFQYNYPFLIGKILIIGSQYDSWAIPNILNINCLKQGFPASL